MYTAEKIEKRMFLKNVVSALSTNNTTPQPHSATAKIGRSVNHHTLRANLKYSSAILSNTFNQQADIEEKKKEWQ